MIGRFKLDPIIFLRKGDRRRGQKRPVLPAQTCPVSISLSRRPAPPSHRGRAWRYAHHRAAPLRDDRAAKMVARNPSWMPSMLMDALVIRGHPWSSMELERLAFGPVHSQPRHGIFSATGVIRHEGLMRRGPLVASIAVMA